MPKNIRIILTAKPFAISESVARRYGAPVADKMKAPGCCFELLQEAGYPTGDERRRVLHVDDCEPFLDLMHSALTKRGYVVDSESDPEQAIRRYDPDVHGAVIVDGFIGKKRYYDILLGAMERKRTAGNASACPVSPSV